MKFLQRFTDESGELIEADSIREAQKVAIERFKVQPGGSTFVKDEDGKRHFIARTETIKVGARGGHAS
jgi:hypothetical protein